MKPIVTADDVSRQVKTPDGELSILDGITLTVMPGDAVAITGPSGSGKTTLRIIIGRLDRPSGGTVSVGDTEINDLSDNQLIDFRKDNIGFVFQAYNLIPVLTAQENVEFVMLLQKRSEQERRQRSQELLAAVGLEDQVNKRPAEMSGGQQQRVAVARALAPKPTFILADEPTANLDSASTNNLLDIMARLNKEEGVTFIFSTHDQRVIDRARRVVTLDDGKIIKDEVRE